MTRAPKKPEDVKDEPGAEERFMRGVKRALETPPQPHKDVPKHKAATPKSKQRPASKGRVHKGKTGD
jgi:hypothetical protein